jgi:ribosome-binding ATPase YchF (GTP1/OBG family)
VRGASKGEGLGNQFLATIREVDASRMWCAASRIPTSPMSRARSIRFADIETIETELMLADLDSLESASTTWSQEGQGQRQGGQGSSSTSSTARWCCCARASRRVSRAQAGGRARLRHARPADVEAGALRLQCRGGSAATATSYFEAGFERAKKEGAVAVVISAKIESEIATLSREERAEFLDTLGLKEPASTA